MTTKASPPAQHSTTGASVGGGVTSVINSSVGLAGVKIKKEIQTDEIKDFAETAMNELLGWYGYDNVDRLDLSTKASRLMAASLHNSSTSNRNELLNNNGSKNNSIRDDSTTPDHDSSREDDSKSPCSTKASEKIEITCGWCHRIVPDSSPEFLRAPDGPRYCTEACFAQSRRASFKRAKQCDWCRHVRHAVSYVDFQDGASQLQFCSDKCLNQYKMQIFCKETQAHLDMNPHLKEKGCDSANVANLITPDLWLKNCRSRSASPQTDGGVGSGGANGCIGNIISGCGSNSRSPTPSMSAISVTPINNLNSGNNHLKTENTRTSGTQQQQQNHKPIISVAPVSKLMSKQHSTSSSSSNILNSNRQNSKHLGRKKRNTRTQNQINSSNNSSNNNNNNNNNFCSKNSNTISNNNSVSNSNNNMITNVNNNITNSNISNNNKAHSLLSPSNTSSVNKSKILLNSLNQNERISQQQQMSGFPNVQDLRLSVPPISPIDRSQSAQSHHSTQSQQHHQQQHQQQNQQIPQIRQNFQPHGYFASAAPSNYPQLGPRLSFPPQGHHLPPPPPHLRSGIHQPPHISLQNLFLPPLEPHLNQLSSLVSGAPPVTVMVPYPIIIPLPIPIPIPLPIIDFIRAAELNSKDFKPSTSPQPQSSVGIQLDPSSSSIVESADDEDDELGENQEPILKTSDENKIVLFDRPERNLDHNSEIKSLLTEGLPNSNTNVSDENSMTNLDEPLDFTKAKIIKKSESSKNCLNVLNTIDKLNDNEENESVIQQIIPDDENLETEENAKQKVPKFIITRLHTRKFNSSNSNSVSGSATTNQSLRTVISPTKESLECSRPLRKRKRVIDCDYNIRIPKDNENNENSSSPKLKK